MNTELHTLSDIELQAMAVTACTAAAQRWLQKLPGAREHIAAGAGLVMEISLMPSPGMRMSLVNSDGKKHPLAWISPDGSLTSLV
jgi:hypothetical protein